MQNEHRMQEGVGNEGAGRGCLEEFLFQTANG